MSRCSCTDRCQAALQQTRLAARHGRGYRPKCLISRRIWVAIPHGFAGLRKSDTMSAMNIACALGSGTFSRIQRTIVEPTA